MLFFDDFSFNFLAGAGAKTVKKSAEKSSLQRDARGRFKRTSRGKHVCNASSAATEGNHVRMTS